MVQPTREDFNNSLFETQTRKDWFKPSQILIGHDSYGKEIWVTVSNKKTLRQMSDKALSELWIKVNFSLEGKGKLSPKSKYISVQSLIDAGIDKEIILKFNSRSFNPALLLTAFRYFTENQAIIESSNIYCPNFSSFTELLKMEPRAIQQLKKAPSRERAEELLRDIVTRHTYHELRTEKLMPAALDIENFGKYCEEGSPYNWQLISFFLPMTMKDEDFKFKLSKQGSHGVDLINYILDHPDEIHEIASHIQSIAEDIQQNTISEETKQLQERILLLASSARYDHFILKHQELKVKSGITFDATFAECFQHQSEISLEDLKDVEGNEIILDESLRKVVLLNIYYELKQNKIIPEHMDQELFVSLTLSHPNSINNWTKAVQDLPKQLTNRQFREILSDYNLSQNGFIDYLLYHPNHMNDSLLDLQKVVESTGTTPKAKVIDLEFLRQRIDKVASFAGLNWFYFQYTGDYPNQKHWIHFIDFLEHMESADMTLKKLIDLQTKGVLEEFFSTVHEDYLDFSKIKEEVPQSTINFSRYLRYIKTFPETSREVSFRILVRGCLKTQPSELQVMLMDAAEAWVENEYAKYRSPVIESLFDINFGANKRWVRNIESSNPKTRIQIDNPTPLTLEHFVEIMTYARNELDKGNVTRVSRLFKETTGLLRTVVLNPQTGRIGILLKGKGVPTPRGQGAFKSVSRRVVVEVDNKSEIYADVSFSKPIHRDVARWREVYRHEFALTGNVFDIEEHLSCKDEKLTVSACEKWLTLPDLKAEHIRTFPLKKRLQLLTDVLIDLKSKHASGIIHADIKTDNMGAEEAEMGENGIVLKGKLTDMGAACALGESRRMIGSPAFYSPQVAENIHFFGKVKMLPQADLWAFGLAMYEVLCTPPNAQPGSRAEPEFYKECEYLARQVVRSDRKKKIIPTLIANIASISQQSVNASIDRMVLQGLGANLLSPKELDLLQDALKSLLHVHGGYENYSLKKFQREALILEKKVIHALKAIIAQLIDSP